MRAASTRRQTRAADWRTRGLRHSSVTRACDARSGVTVYGPSGMVARPLRLRLLKRAEHRLTTQRSPSPDRSLAAEPRNFPYVTGPWRQSAPPSCDAAPRARRGVVRTCSPATIAGASRRGGGGNFTPLAAFIEIPCSTADSRMPESNTHALRTVCHPLVAGTSLRRTVERRAARCSGATSFNAGQQVLAEHVAVAVLCGPLPASAAPTRSCASTNDKGHRGLQPLWVDRT